MRPNLERRGPMTRVTFLMCLVATANAVAVLPVLGQLEDGPWPMFHHDLQHTGRSPYIGPDEPILQWSFPTGGSVFSSPTVGGDGTIYVGSDDCELYAIYPDGSL
jgi:hypothetical protein